jgi:hypothetical protein
MGRFAAEYEASLETPSICVHLIRKPPHFNFVLTFFFLLALTPRRRQHRARRQDSPTPRQVHYPRCCSRLEGASIEHGGKTPPLPDRYIIPVAAHASKAPASSTEARLPHSPKRTLFPLLLTPRRRQHRVRWQDSPHSPKRTLFPLLLTPRRRQH